jgi:hypothetical protein
LSRDPIGLAGGTNAYDYVDSNPVGLIDPRGLFEISSIAGAIGNPLEQVTSITGPIGTIISIIEPVNSAGQWLNFSTWEYNSQFYRGNRYVTGDTIKLLKGTANSLKWIADEFGLLDLFSDFLNYVHCPTSANRNKLIWQGLQVGAEDALLPLEAFRLGFVTGEKYLSPGFVYIFTGFDAARTRQILSIY